MLVAGSGAGGVTGAYTAAREGLDVVLVEATDKYGGTTAYSGGGGMWFPCNPVLRRAGVDDTLEDALEYYNAVVGDRTPAALREAYVRGGAPLIEYLEADEQLKFTLLPWPDYFGAAPKARADGMRHIAAKATAGRRRTGSAGTDPRPVGHRPTGPAGTRGLLRRRPGAHRTFPDRVAALPERLDPGAHGTDRAGGRGRQGGRRDRRDRRPPPGHQDQARCPARRRRVRAQRRDACPFRRARRLPGLHGAVGKSGPRAPGRHRGGRRHRSDGPGVVVAGPDPSRRHVGVRAVVHRRHLRRRRRQAIRQRVRGV